MRGKFITIEGTEGVGKTTNIQFIQSWMDKHKLAYATTREPGGTPLAEQIRELLLSPPAPRSKEFSLELREIGLREEALARLVG